TIRICLEAILRSDIQHRRGHPESKAVPKELGKRGKIHPTERQPSASNQRIKGHRASPIKLTTSRPFYRKFELIITLPICPGRKVENLKTDWRQHQLIRLFAGLITKAEITPDQQKLAKRKTRQHGRRCLWLNLLRCLLRRQAVD